MKASRRRGLADEILRGLEKRTQGDKHPRNLSRDMVELNVLRTFGAAVSERLDRASILEALENQLPRLFEYAILLALIDLPNQTELHVYPRRKLDPELQQRMIVSTIDSYSRLRSTPLNAADISIQIHEPTPKFSKRKRAETSLDSHITLPLVSGGERAGCLSIAQVGRDTFGPLKVQLFSLVVYLLGAALRNSVLLEETREKAVRDSLTGLFNRRHFNERLEQECRRARRYRCPVAVIMGDVDHFKSINDVHGHGVGDQVLKQVAQALTDGARTSDVVCRYGGEEFAVILPETSVEDAALVAERLRALVPTAIHVAQLDKPLQMSFGVAAINADDSDTKPDLLVNQADSALYLAKRRGRNNVCAASKGRVHELRDLASVEKRRFPRAHVRLRGTVLLVPDIGDVAEPIHSIDISNQGVRMTVKRRLPPGAFVLIELEHADGPRPLRLLAKVVWTTAMPNGTIEVGTRILAFDATSEPRLKKIVDKSLG